MKRDAQYYRDRLAEIKLVLASGRRGGRNVGQLIKARDFCKRRIIECEYQDKVDVILDSN